MAIILVGLPIYHIFQEDIEVFIF